MKKTKSIFDYDGILLYCTINIGLIISFWFFLENTLMGFAGLIIAPILYCLIFWLGLEIFINLVSIGEKKSRLSWFRSLVPIIIGILLWIIHMIG